MRKARRAADPTLTADTLRALLTPRSRRRAPAGFSSAPTLGPGGALWLPERRSPESSLRPATAPPGWLIVSQGRPLASLLCSLAARQGVRLVGALCTGNEPRATWDDVVVAASALDPTPAILLALHRPVLDTQLLRATAACPTVLLLPLGAARTLRVPSLAAPRHPLPPISIEELATSLGWVVLHTPEQQIVAASLAPLGIRRRTGRTRAVASDEDEVAMLEGVLACAGIPCNGAPAADRRDSTRSPHVVVDGWRTPRPALPGDAELVLQSPPPGRAPRPARARRPHPAPPPRVSLAQLAPLDAGLAALGAMLRTPPWRPPPAPDVNARWPQSRRRESRQAHALLARWPSALDDAHVGELARCFGVAAAPGHLVGSASAAGAAASEIDGPVLLRFLRTAQPTPRHDLAREQLPTAAAVRQAYRDLAVQLAPVPPAAHAWVTPQPPAALALRCVVLPSGGRPLVAAARHDHASELVARYGPFDAEDAERFAWQVLADEEPFRGAALRVARLFGALGRVALATAGRLSWLHLDRVAFAPRPALLVIEGFGAQQR